MTAIIITLELLAALAISIQAVIRLNHMRPSTRLPIGVAWVALGGAGGSIAASLLSGRPAADGGFVMMLVAVAALVWIDRRQTR